ncbi:hypothetical protein C4J81_16630 [Deltaproteobacteria bacterium Smac51]|nr:hypothetical protein C4J81_16630 [Deltaproteobacteria bacterium Smac51]
MPEWNQGYMTDVNYTKNAFNEFSPANINFALTLSSQPVPDLNKPFTYAELGAGFGLSISSWAAQYPNGEFHSIDFNPSQSAWLTKLRDGAELKNLHIHERSFNQMLGEELPQFDYIIIHGILSWIKPEVRKDIRDFMTKFLKPGGVVYVGYNAQPGWSTVGPLRHIILEGAKSTGEKNPIVALTQGLNFLKELKEAGAVYFKAVGNASNWLDSWFQADRNYLVGELLNNEHKAFYFSEMMDEMAEAKTSYVGSLELANYLEPLITPQEFLKRLEQVSGSLALRETVKDMLYNSTFRYDLFVKGPQPLPRTKAEKALNKVKVVLSGLRGSLPEKVTLKGVQVTLKPEVYEPVMEFLSKGPATMEETSKASGLKFNQAAQAITVLLALGWAQAAPPAAKVEAVKKYNLALDDLLGPEAFNSLLTVNGSWLRCGFLDRLYGLAVMKGVDPVKFVTEMMKERDWQLSHEGQPVTEAAKLKTFLKDQVKKMDEQLLPVFKRMGLYS